MGKIFKFTLILNLSWLILSPNAAQAQDSLKVYLSNSNMGETCHWDVLHYTGSQIVYEKRIDKNINIYLPLTDDAILKGYLDQICLLYRFSSKSWSRYESYFLNDESISYNFYLKDSTVSFYVTIISDQNSDSISIISEKIYFKIQKILADHCYENGYIIHTSTKDETYLDIIKNYGFYDPWKVTCFNLSKFLILQKLNGKKFDIMEVHNNSRRLKKNDKVLIPILPCADPASPGGQE